MPRTPLGRSVFYDGAITTSVVQVSTTDTNIEEMILSNTTTTEPITITFTRAVDDTVMGKPIMISSDQIIRNYGNAWWFFQGGLKISADAVGIRYQITGNQRP
jgi:hypothetical protein